MTLKCWAMAMTNREEVAKNLRELRHKTYYREEIVESITDAISIADPVNTFREPEDVYELLADFIDPTCKPVEVGDNIVCSECGADLYDDDLYCSRCGARVVRDDG